MTSPTEVLICIECQLLRAGLKAILRQDPTVEVVGESATGHGTVTQVLAFEPDVVLIDAAFPDLTGAEVVRRIREHLPDTPMLVLTVCEQDQLIESCLRAGASDSFPKDGAAGLLIEKISKLRSGSIRREPKRAYA